MELTRSLTIAVLMFVALASLVVAALNATATTLQQEPVAGQPSPAAPAASHATIIATWITAAGAAIGGVIALRIVIHWCMIRRVFRGSGGTIIALLGESQCKVMPSCANVVEDPISYESENVYFEVGEDKYMLCTRALERLRNEGYIIPVSGVAGRAAGIPRRIRDRGVARAGLRARSVGPGGSRASQGVRA